MSDQLGILRILRPGLELFLTAHAHTVPDEFLSCVRSDCPAVGATVIRECCCNERVTLSEKMFV